MNVVRLKPFKKDYKSLPSEIRKKADKQLKLLFSNLRHPSLRAKKMVGKEDVWEIRITSGYRMTFMIQGDTYILRRIGTHNILKRES